MDILYLCSSFYFCHWGNSLHMSVSRTTWKVFEWFFVKSCTIINYCYGKNPFCFGVGSIHNGRMAAILDFCYSMLLWTSLKSIQEKPHFRLPNGRCLDFRPCLWQMSTNLTLSFPHYHDCGKNESIKSFKAILI